MGALALRMMVVCDKMEPPFLSAVGGVGMGRAKSRELSLLPPL